VRAALFSAVAAGLMIAPAVEAEPSGAIVAFGDSITVGRPTPWTDALRARLHERFPRARVTVVNAGIGGNQLLHGVPVLPSGLSRFANDALGAGDVRIVILLEGINDIGALDLAHTTTEPDGAKLEGSAAIIDAYRTLIAQAHARHVRIYGGTLLPFAGTTYPGYYAPAGEAMRVAVNQWIRSAGAFDAAIDFDAALRDPANPTRLRPDYDSGDHLHPNAAGEAAMADAVNLTLLE
jgi:lysophospholipase L1-like esterase